MRRAAATQARGGGHGTPRSGRRVVSWSGRGGDRAHLDERVGDDQVETRAGSGRRRAGGRARAPACALARDQAGGDEEDQHEGQQHGGGAEGPRDRGRLAAADGGVDEQRQRVHHAVGRVGDHERPRRRRSAAPGWSRRRRGRRRGCTRSRGRAGRSAARRARPCASGWRRAPGWPRAGRRARRAAPRRRPGR